MAISLASNIDSVKAQRQVSLTTSALSKTFERLSSGLRINRASDDPAGLAVSELLNRDAKIASVAIRNANDGISITSLADAALSEISNALERMSELAAQSANGTYSNYQRSALSSEFVALGSEIERIAKTTTFNNIQLLSNTSNITLQVGLDSTANSQITITAVLATLSSLSLGTTSGALTYSIIGTSTAASELASTTAYSAVQTAYNSLLSTRGTVGAVESRLNVAVNYLTVARENFTAAGARIRDADVAQEVAEMVRLQVLQQAGTAIIAQANQQPSRVLALLS